jgi:hypothetical protein
MWTTSSFRAERRRLRWAAAAGVVLASCGPGSRGGNVPPDAPRPARDVSTLAQPPAHPVSPALQDQPVEISAVRLRRVRGDTMLTRLAGAERMGRTRDPIAIDVTTAGPLGNVSRNASLEIYLNGVRVGDTWSLLPDHLIAFLPDREPLVPGASVTAAWSGDEERTRSRRPVLLTEEHLRQLQ